jgi:DNA-binding beta-propeller fold protein YncE
VPFVVAFNSSTKHLFVTAADDNKVVVLAPYSIQLNKAQWMTWRGKPVLLLDQNNAGWIKEIGIGAGAEEGIAVNPNSGYVYVTNGKSDTLSILRDSSTVSQIQWIKDIAVGDRPTGVDVDLATNTIYVGNADSRDLTVISGATHTILKTIPLD